MRYDAAWPVCALVDAAEAITVGYVGSMAAEYVPRGIPFLRSQNVRPFALDLTDVAYIGPEFHGRLAKSALRAGDVVIVRTGVPGIAAVVPDDLGPANCSDLVIVRPGRRFDSRFLCYAINVLAREHVSAHLVGAVQQHFNVGAARIMQLPIPSRDEQRAVAETVGALDDKIALNRRMNRTLEATAAALFRSWFMDFDPVAAKAEGRRAPGVPDAVHAAMPSDFGEFDGESVPDSWTLGTLSDVTTINAQQVGRDYPYTEIEYVDISSVERGRVVSTSRVELAAAPSRARRLVSHGDVIWSCVRPNHRAFVRIDQPPANLVVSTGFAVLTPRRVPSSYLYAHASTTAFADYLVARAEGSAYPAVRPKDFAHAPVLIPSLQVLTGYDAIVSPLLSRVAANERENRTLAALRDALLPQLLSGALRLRDAERAVAATI